MHVALGLLAAALVGEPSPTPDITLISYQVRVLEMAGLDWRESVYSRLTPRAHAGATAVWTTGPEVMRAVLARADRVDCAPKMAMVPGVRGFFEFAQQGPWAARTWSEAGAHGRVWVDAGEPSREPAGTGFRGSVRGLVEGQGMRVRLSLEDAQVTTVHEVKLTGSAPDDVVLVPEVAAARVSGEWMVPYGKVLVVSLGARTVVDAETGAASVRERLAIVEPEVRVVPERPAGAAAAGAPISRAVYVPMVPPVALGPRAPVVVTLPDSRSLLLLGRTLEAPGLAHPLLRRPGAGVVSSPAAVAAGRSMPTPPARSLPPAFGPDGSPTALPPLPDDALEPVAGEESAEPRPSPQSRPRPAAPRADDAPPLYQPGPGARSDREAAPTSAAARSHATPGARPHRDPGLIQADLPGRPADACCAGPEACPATAEDASPRPVTIQIQIQGLPGGELRASASWTPGTRRPATVPKESR